MKLQLAFLFTFFICICLSQQALWAQQAASSTTYAEKLGWKKGERVLILHIDDAGMSYDSNLGTILALEKGVANSVSVMMPCSWAPGFVKYLKAHPKVDAGLHLTLTSEWEDYRWGPLSGKKGAPGLVDEEGAFWESVPLVVEHATADEVEAEIRAQLERARSMGFNPTHLDSHMGTLFATPDFLQRYMKVGLSEKIPVMFPGGHNSLLLQQFKAEGTATDVLNLSGQLGQMLWEGGLPVLDDLHNSSYNWNLPTNTPQTDENLRKMKVEKYIQAIKSLKPGVTMMIMHCTSPTEVFSKISASGPTRKGDLLAMLDPAVRKTLQDEGIVLTTWRELMMRRESVHSGNK